MGFSYKPLWKLLIDKDMTKKRLMYTACISKSTMDKMGRGKPVSLEILGRICEQLDCNIEDIVSYQKEDS
jgi:DNA-binding Xre family transcriptional regulator